MGSQPYSAYFFLLVGWTAHPVEAAEHLPAGVAVAYGIQQRNELRILLAVDCLQLYGKESGFAEAVAFEEIWR